MSQSAILRVYSERSDLNLSPSYQRNGDIWNLEKRQLLIDSILNEFDIPKLYFHVIDENSGRFAVIDGRQRLESIFGFIDGKFGLSEEFDYYPDPTLKLAGLTYHEIAEKYPKIKIRFDATYLPIVLVDTDEEELIDDMFSRLNEAVPLNAAEKRNAYGGAVVSAINGLSNHRFFADKVRFSNRRYQHREVAARILFLESMISVSNKVVDTKKAYIDNFAKNDRNEFNFAFVGEVEKTLDLMANLFVDQDELLRAQASVPIYYLLVREAQNQNKLSTLQRSKLVQFRTLLDQNRRAAEYNIADANYEMLEYDRLSQQGTNDASSIQKRLEILSSFCELDKSKIAYV